MRIRRRVHHDAPPREGLHFVPDTLQQFAMRLDGIELCGLEIERQRQEQPLRGCAIAAELAHHVFVEHALMRRVLIDNRDALVGLEEDEGLEDLQQRWRQVFGVSCQGVGAEEFERHSGMCGARIRLALKPNT